MAVLVEAISVVIRKEAIDKKWKRGWHEFMQSVPNRTFCADDDLVRVGFMTPPDVGKFIGHLEEHGLRFLEKDRAIDIVVVDQIRGPMNKCTWIEYGRFNYHGQGEIAACWLFTDQRKGYSIHLPGKKLKIATPDGWQYENSLSRKFVFVPLGEENSRLKFIRKDDNVDVYKDLNTNKEVYIGRS